MSEIAKRRLNYITSEDFYFLTYELLLLLKEMSSSTGATFRDHRKLAYLVYLVSDARMIGILERNEGRKIASSVDKELLFSSFTAGELHKREIYKIMLALQKREFITLSKGAEPEVFDVQIRANELPPEFFKTAQFDIDRRIINRLKKLIPKISSMKIDTFLDRAYKAYGLNVWVC